MYKKRKTKQQDPNTDLFTNEDHSEEDLSWMIDGVKLSPTNTNKPKGHKNETVKRSVKKHR